ncbi:MAG: glycosyltransferase family 92 protein, partial [Opitutaceae bacterium]
MKREPRRELVACAALRNEGRYLREWIEFHKLAGVEHFYLYDQGSSDGTRRVAAEYAARGEATSIRWRDGLDAPVAAYNHCLDHYGSGA